MKIGIGSMGVPNLEGEVWKNVTVEPYQNSYAVSNLGRVKSLARTIKASNRIISYGERLLKQNKDTGGHLQVCLCAETKRRTLYVHRLIMFAFVGEPPAGKEVCHNNGVHTDNRLENLRYDTRSANMIDKIKHGTHNWYDSEGNYIRSNP